MEDKDIIKMRDTFREVANILDEILELGKRADNGENVDKEVESAFGRYMLKFMQLEELR